MKSVTLTGRVTDAVDNEPLVGVSIYLPELKQGAVTNADGRYKIDHLPTVKTLVQVSYVGHQTIVTSVDLLSQHTMDFVLSESNAMLSEVTVTGLTGVSLADRSPSCLPVCCRRRRRRTSSTPWLISPVCRRSPPAAASRNPSSADWAITASSSLTMASARRASSGATSTASRSTVRPSTRWKS